MGSPTKSHHTHFCPVGYSVIAFNLIVPQNLDPTLFQSHFPFEPTQPPFPDLDPRTAPGVIRNGYAKTILQLSRLTMVMDETVAGGGKGVFGFVSIFLILIGLFLCRRDMICR